MDNSDIHGMTDAQLRRILLTCDGKGVDVKTLALDELLTRRDHADLAQAKILDLRHVVSGLHDVINRDVSDNGL